MADQRIQYTECLVGANMPGKSDVLNRLALISHKEDGSHRDADFHGTKSVLLGHDAGTSNSTGIYNTFIGIESGYSNTTGKYNSYIGYQA